MILFSGMVSRGEVENFGVHCGSTKIIGRGLNMNGVTFTRLEFQIAAFPFAIALISILLTWCLTFIVIIFSLLVIVTCFKIKFVNVYVIKVDNRITTSWDILLYENIVRSVNTSVIYVIKIC